jgi:hypothetical protein
MPSHRPTRISASGIRIRSLPETSTTHTGMDAAIAALRDRRSDLRRRRDAYDQLLNDRAAERADRDAAIERGEDLPSARTDWEVLISDAEHAVEVAQRLVAEAEDELMRVARRDSVGVHEAAEAVRKEVRRKSRQKKLGQLESAMDEIAAADALAAWMVAIANDRMVDFRHRPKPDPSVEEIQSRLIGPADRKSDAEKVAKVIARVGLKNVLKPFEVRSMVPWKLAPADVAIEAHVDIETAKRVIARSHKEAAS